MNHHRGHAIRDWCADNNVELAFTPTYASWANPIEAHFGPLRQFVIANSDHRDHPALARAIRKYVRWRNDHTRDPEVLDAQRRPHPQRETTTMWSPTNHRRIALKRSCSEH